MICFIYFSKPTVIVEILVYNFVCLILFLLALFIYIFRGLTTLLIQ